MGLQMVKINKNGQKTTTTTRQHLKVTVDTLVYEMGVTCGAGILRLVRYGKLFLHISASICGA